MKKLFALLVALSLFTSGHARAQSALITQATLVANADPTTDTVTWMVFGDLSAAAAQLPYVSGVLGPGTAINKLVETTGTSATITGVASNAPFQGRAVGDLLIFPNVSGLRYERTIATFTNANSIAANATIDLDNSTADDGTGTGYTFRVKKLLTGTAAGTGWFSVQGFKEFTITGTVATLNATSLDMDVECRVTPNAGGVLTTTNFTAVGTKAAAFTGPYDSCRVGWSFNTDAGVSAVSSHFIGEK